MQKLLSHSIFVRDESRCQSPDPVGDGIDDISPWPSLPGTDQHKAPKSPRDKERPNVGLPRQATFHRQNSERRERLCPVESTGDERRATSANRHASTSCIRRRRTRSSPTPINPCRVSAPAAATLTEVAQLDSAPMDMTQPEAPEECPARPPYNDSVFDYEDRSSRPPSRTSSVSWDEDHTALLQRELDTRWILNLSMHFRDKSDREKFFVTYAETPTRWRRVTVSCDYRHAESGSLEMDLRELQFQRDKSLAVYEAIRDSLPDIQFYETVTNLKLETSEGRLHVHVTEDVNEIIAYPQRSLLRHILDDQNLDARPLELCERDIAFDSHLSGFVYRVWHQDKIYIKKEIPSPDTVDEFLYEINALHALHDSQNVIKLEAIILDDARQVVKGLLISFAERGAVVDLLYENKGLIPWEHRELWARQAIMGLRDIHEEGYVQGDFTLSNIVVDESNNARIIDINRRGCPVGWEPPEIAQKIASNQRISMYIGEKSDLYQLGMTLWALAMDDDEPERHDPPLMTDEFPSEVPEWFRSIVRICLSPRPRDRLSAKELVKLFPTPAEPCIIAPQSIEISPRPHPVLRTEQKQYIDPDAAVERADIERFKHQEDLLYSPQSSKDDWTFTYPRSSEYEIESAESGFEGFRGRDPVSRGRRYSLDNRLARPLSDTQSADRANGRNTPQIFDAVPDDEDEKYDELRFDGKPYLVRAGTFSSAEMHILNDVETSSDHFTTMTLAPTVVEKSPSPFRLPMWRRSLSASDTTPRNSRAPLLPGTLSFSPQISPRSSSLAVPQRPRSADFDKSARSSDETVSGCGLSVGETVYSGTTAFTHESDQHQLLQRKHRDTERIVTSDGPPITSSTLIQPLPPTLMINDSGYDEPTLHEITKA